MDPDVMSLDDLRQRAGCTDDCTLTVEITNGVAMYSHRQRVGDKHCSTSWQVPVPSDLDAPKVVDFCVKGLRESHRVAALGPPDAVAAREI